MISVDILRKNRIYTYMYIWTVNPETRVRFPAAPDRCFRASFNLHYPPRAFFHLLYKLLYIYFPLAIALDRKNITGKKQQ